MTYFKNRNYSNFIQKALIAFLIINSTIAIYSIIMNQHYDLGLFNILFIFSLVFFQKTKKYDSIRESIVANKIPIICYSICSILIASVYLAVIHN